MHRIILTVSADTADSLKIRVRQGIRAGRHSSPGHLDRGADRRTRLPQASLLYLSEYPSHSNDRPRLSDRYGFQRPNDRRALDLMNAAAAEVMKDISDMCIAYGVSDEYRSVCISSRRASRAGH